MERNQFPNSHKKSWRSNGLRTGVIFDIHRVLWVNVDPVDVRNDYQQGTRPHAIISSNFLMWVWGVISFHSSKKSPVNKIAPYQIQSGNTKNDTFKAKNVFQRVENLMSSKNETDIFNTIYYRFSLWFCHFLIQWIFQTFEPGFWL